MFHFKRFARLALGLLIFGIGTQMGAQMGGWIGFAVCAASGALFMPFVFEEKRA